MKQHTDPRPPLPFGLSVLGLVLGPGALGLLLTLFTGILISNVFFIAAILYLLVAVVPIFTEVGGNARAGLQARREGKAARDVIAGFEKAGKYSSGTRITFIFGLSGLLCFVLAVLTL